MLLLLLLLMLLLLMLLLLLRRRNEDGEEWKMALARVRRQYPEVKKGDEVTGEHTWCVPGEGDGGRVCCPPGK